MNSTNSSFPGAVSRSRLRVLAIVLVAGVISGPSTAWADDIVLRWNEIAAKTATATSPFNQSRVAAIVQLAVFEAVNAITREYEPYLNPATVAPPRASAADAVTTPPTPVPHTPAFRSDVRGAVAWIDTHAGRVKRPEVRVRVVEAVGHRVSWIPFSRRRTAGAPPARRPAARRRRSRRPTRWDGGRWRRRTTR